MSHPNEICTTSIKKFLIVGILACEEFQKCKYILTKLHQCFPKLYAKPEMRPMLSMEWEEYLLKMQREKGPGHKMWALKKFVAVFLNGDYLGDDAALSKYITTQFRFNLNQDWYAMGKNQLIDYITDILSSYRQLVYLTIAIKGRVIGSMLFKLYSDLVPLACENFLARCSSEVGGYSGTPVHRIVLNSWIQCGGFEMIEKKIPCENYIIPHDRRGVLSMCNSGKHKNNSCQFFVTLASTPWMDYRYVAFGQMIQGAEILSQIEAVSTYRETPIVNVDIVKSGEFTLTMKKSLMPENELDAYLRDLYPVMDSKFDTKYDVCYPDAASIYTESKHKLGLYCLATDLKSYFPLNHLPNYILTYLKHFDEPTENGEEHPKHPYKPMALVEGACGFHTPPPTPSVKSFDRPYFNKYSGLQNKGYIKSLLDSNITI